MSFWLKPLTVSALALGLGAASLAQAATPAELQAQRVDNRQARQDARIDQGAASGQLTPREQRRLRHQQQHVSNLEDRVEADGKVTGKEAAHMEHAQDRASRNIYRKKHNHRN
ncbi:hypothetical protein [Hydrogenophaga sp. RWCD_12]|uniref:hypothetical protein n=1 Tax=Hydrogenophaga sp. RWCD_12 TaxID=3391190 RepID=UPI003985515C